VLGFVSIYMSFHIWCVKEYVSIELKFNLMKRNLKLLLNKELKNKVPELIYKKIELFLKKKLQYTLLNFKLYNFLKIFTFQSKNFIFLVLECWGKGEKIVGKKKEERKSVWPTINFVLIWFNFRFLN
jgi:hypothetical protein